MKRWGQNLREVMVDHAPWELFFMRGLLAWLIWRMLPDTVPFDTQPFPSGLARLMDLTFLGRPAVFAGLRALAPVALALYALGLAPLLTLGYMAALLTAVGALENSQGAIGHHLQLLCLVVLAQWLAYAAAAVRSAWAGPRPFSPAATGTLRAGQLGQLLFTQTEAHRRATQAAKLMIAAAYVASGWTKLIASGGGWIAQLPDLSLQLVKTHANKFYDTLEPLPTWSEQLPRLIAEHPHLTRLAFTPGLLLELGAVLALTGRRAACAVGLGLLAMHLLARQVMELGFLAHEWLLLIFFVNLPWLALAGVGRFFEPRPALAPARARD